MGFLAVKDDSFLCVRFFLPFPSAMAKKQHEISEFNRGQVVGAHKFDISEKRIADKFKIAKSTVHYIIKQYKEFKLTKPQPRSGRPQKFKDCNKRYLVQLVEKEHSASLNQITNQIQETMQETVSIAIVRHILHIEGYARRIGLRKPFVSNTNHLKHYKWCQEQLIWKTKWNNIIWSDELQFKLFRMK